jgi:hypothetical protein
VENIWILHIGSLSVTPALARANEVVMTHLVEIVLIVDEDKIIYNIANYYSMAGIGFD